VLIAAGVGMVIILALGQGLFQNMKATNYAEIRGDAQNFSTAIKLSVQNEGSCKSTLMVPSTILPSPAPTLPLLSVANSQLPSTGASPSPGAPIPLTQLSVGGVVHTANPTTGTIVQKLRLTQASLVLKQKISTAGYLADLKYTLKKLNPSSSIGAENFDYSVPIQVSLTDNPLSPGTSVLASCVTSTSSDPEADCEKMGGRWLTGTMMPKERCNLTQELRLATNEWPNADSTSGKFKAIPSRGERNAAGEAISKCYYQTGTTFSEARCSTYANINTAGTKCWFDVSRRQWLVSTFTAGNTPAALPKYVCSGGVSVSATNSTLRYLNWYDGLGRAFSVDGATAPFDPGSWQEQDHLNTVLRCRKDRDLDTWVTCKNPEDSTYPYEGKAFSCLWVNNVKLVSVTAADFNAELDDVNNGNPSLALRTNGKDIANWSMNNYTGWLYAYSATWDRIKSDNITGSTPHYGISEATGQPCFEVEVNAFSTPPIAGAPLPTKDAPTVDHAKDPARVAQCIYEAPQYLASHGGDPVAGRTSGVTGINRFMTYTCKNGGGVTQLAKFDPTAPAFQKWARDANTGATASFNDPRGALGKIMDVSTNSNPTGTLGSELLLWSGIGATTPQFQAGSCWYFEKIKLAGFNDAIYGGNQYYTGWVYLEGAPTVATMRPRKGALERDNYGGTWYLENFPTTDSGSGAGRFNFTHVLNPANLTPSTAYPAFNVHPQQVHLFTSASTTMTTTADFGGCVNNVDLPSAAGSKDCFLYRVQETPAVIPDNAVTGQGSNTLNAIPCNVGVRIAPASP
jgi:hypothetical protein